MKVATSRFGDMEIPEEVIIRIPEGILGFPEDRRFAVLEHDAEGTPFRWLQSLDTPSLAFIVVDPRLFEPAYRLEFDEDTVGLFGPVVAEDVVPMVIVNVPKTHPIAMTANLRAPIIVHATKRLGRQIVLMNEEYLISYRLFPENPAGKTAQAVG